MYGEDNELKDELKKLHFKKINIPPCSPSI